MHSTPLLSALLATLPWVAVAQDGTLQPVTVKASANAAQPLGAVTPDPADLKADRAFTSDTAGLLRNLPGVGLYGAGGVSSLPSVHGLADDRLRIQVDGMDLVSACGNHMNPPLSYIDPTRVGSVRLFAGITPVSVGGDSIGATIQVDSPEAEFAAPGRGSLVKGELGASYRSNGDSLAAHASASYATEQLNLRYDGSSARSGNYRAARAFKAEGAAASDKPDRRLSGDEVGSTSYRSRNHALAVAAKSDRHLLEARLGLQDIPYQGFPNQRMDMIGNDSSQVNLSYRGRFDWGALQARAYREKTRHSMQFGHDKQFWYGTTSNVPGMPMDTEGVNTGAQVKAEMALNARDTLRVGAEAQRYRLDDWWLPSGGGMAPDTFWSIRDGRRDRLDVFGEWEARWSPQWLSQVGVRSANVRSDTGPVQGYNAGYAAEAAAFNARDRKRTDNNVDFTALARYVPNAVATYEFGYAHKTRSPNLYERYAWSTGGMAMRMINFAGDGNGYVGDMDLRPEVANTVSATADWHDPSGEAWSVRLTPYLSYVHDFIDTKRCGGGGAMSACSAANSGAREGFVYLRFANEDARLYGWDLSGSTELARTQNWGSVTLSGLLSYARGKNRRTGDNLYNIMPLNARITLNHRMGGWRAAAEVLLVASKERLSSVRNEVATAGYALLNLRASHEWARVRLDVGIENVFDRFYNHPLGGAYLGQGRTMAATAVPWGVPVPGMGRSINLGMTMTF
ncbi:MAG: TonB-dependent receptor plug domain-containing protein [Ramlibacter sp.]|nr:TonB-dependent receptor plug domain-containing protein [Ramlibacter sp.]